MRRGVRSQSCAQTWQARPRCWGGAALTVQVLGRDAQSTGTTWETQLYKRTWLNLSAVHWSKPAMAIFCWLVFEGRIWACWFFCGWISLFLVSTFFCPFKIWIRIAVVYNASPKSRHQRMWLAAMKPLAVHTEHSWLLGRKNRSKAIMSCHCNNPPVALLSLTEQTRWICSRWEPRHSHRELCASKMHFPLLLLADSIKKREITSSCGSSISEHNFWLKHILQLSTVLL